MDKDLIKNLKKLAAIKPDPNYSRSSFNAIIFSKKHEPAMPKSPFANIFVRVGLAICGLIIVISLAIKNDIPLQLAGLDPQGLQAEAEELDQQLKLTEVSYKGPNSTDLALKEAAQSGPGHLNNLILKKESGNWSPQAYKNEGVDKALKALTE